jgi:hypothetical protein
MIRIPARAYTEPFPPKVLVARGKKKVTDTTIGGTKGSFPLCKTGAFFLTPSLHTQNTSSHLPFIPLSPE